MKRARDDADRVNLRLLLKFSLQFKTKKKSLSYLGWNVTFI